MSRYYTIYPSNNLPSSRTIPQGSVSPSTVGLSKDLRSPLLDSDFSNPNLSNFPPGYDTFHPMVDEPHLSNYEPFNDREIYDDDDDQGPLPPMQSGSQWRPLPARKGRTTLNEWQRSVLYSKFTESRLPSTSERLELAAYLGLKPRQVQVWFQNRRQDERTKAQDELWDPVRYRNRSAEAQPEPLSGNSSNLRPSQPRLPSNSTESYQNSRPLPPSASFPPSRGFYDPYEHTGPSSYLPSSPRTLGFPSNRPMRPSSSLPTFTDPLEDYAPSRDFHLMAQRLNSPLDPNSPTSLNLNRSRYVSVPLRASPPLGPDPRLPRPNYMTLGRPVASLRDELDPLPGFEDFLKSVGQQRF